MALSIYAYQIASTYTNVLKGITVIEHTNFRRRGVGDKPMYCKPGVAGSIPGFSQSVGWDFKPLPRLLRRFKTKTTAGWAFGSSWT